MNISEALQQLTQSIQETIDNPLCLDDIESSESDLQDLLYSVYNLLFTLYFEKHILTGRRLEILNNTLNTIQCL